MSWAVAEEFREERRRKKVKRKREGNKRRTEEEETMCRTKMKLRRTVMQHFGRQQSLNLIKEKMQ